MYDNYLTNQIWVDIFRWGIGIKRLPTFVLLADFLYNFVSRSLCGCIDTH